MTGDPRHAESLGASGTAGVGGRRAVYSARLYVYGAFMKTKLTITIDEDVTTALTGMTL